MPGELRGLRTSKMVFDTLRILAWEVCWKQSGGPLGGLLVVLGGCRRVLGRLLGLLGRLWDSLGSLAGTLNGSE